MAHTQHSRAARDRRQGVAEANQIERAKRSNEQQLNELNRRLGEGEGAAKERARLAA